MKSLTRTAAVALVSLGVLAGACGSDAEPTTQPSTTPASPAGGAARQIELRAASLAFSRDEIRVSAGRELVIRLLAADYAHILTIGELDLKVEAGAGETAESRFAPTAGGRYAYYCSISGHREGPCRALSWWSEDGLGLRTKDGRAARSPAEITPSGHGSRDRRVVRRRSPTHKPR